LAFMASPEMQYVAPMFRAMWSPGPSPSPEVLARNQRENVLGERIVRALRDGGARLVVGTDTGNPFVIPGFSVHEELARLVHAGLTPYEALRAATHDAAELLDRADSAGIIAVGRQADLLLLDADPRVDVQHTRRIAGVMARGRWLSAGDLEKLLATVASSVKDEVDPFAASKPMTITGTRVFGASFAVVWKGARFGVEQLLVERDAAGRIVVHARSYDRQFGQSSTLQLSGGASGEGVLLVLASEGAKGRGELTLGREGPSAHVGGTLLSGMAFTKDVPLTEGDLLGPADFLAGKVLLGQRLVALDIGQSVPVRIDDVSLGSSVSVSPTHFDVTRAADEQLLVHGVAMTARVFTLSPEKGPKPRLWLDAQGWPLAYEVPSFGATVRFERLN
ncbi:MAG: amidohydrolase family protein, partial [Polyangiales bacterium]